MLQDLEKLSDRFDALDSELNMSEEFAMLDLRMKLAIAERLDGILEAMRFIVEKFDVEQPKPTTDYHNTS